MDKVVLVHGCFDVLHFGHLLHLQEAKKYGDKLIVSITTDRFVNKGPGRPYFTTEKRAGMLRSLRIVDEVITCDEPTALSAIHRVKPHFYVKGPDYKDFSRDVTGEIINEKAAVEKYGGQLVFTDSEVFSSGHIINRFLQNWTDEQKATIERIKELGGYEACEKAIEEIKKLKILVTGEPILDVYRFVQPEGISSKSPSISARFQYEEVYQGGSIAIANHLSGFVDTVLLHSWNALPAKKIRYIAGSQRVFEVTEIDDRYWENHSTDFFCDKLIEHRDKCDAMIVADFGHGMFEGSVKGILREVAKDIWTSINVQTNSSNYGFNPFTKHTVFNYLCIDTREARLGLHDRWTAPKSLLGQIAGMSSPAWVSLTQGPQGASLAKLSGGVVYYSSPAFADNVLDATGAGDAYFAITSLLLKTDCKPELVPFIGNVFAGLKTKIIGNKSAVSKAQLLKAIGGILK